VHSGCEYSHHSVNEGFLCTQQEVGNKLEQSVFQKPQDPLELAHLKVDAIMFHHVYCNLVMLAKSTK